MPYSKSAVSWYWVPLFAEDLKDAKVPYGSSSLTRKNRSFLQLQNPSKRVCFYIPHVERATQTPPGGKSKISTGLIFPDLGSTQVLYWAGGADGKTLAGWASWANIETPRLGSHSPHDGKVHAGKRPEISSIVTSTGVSMSRMKFNLY